MVMVEVKLTLLSLIALLSCQELSADKEYNEEALEEGVDSLGTTRFVQQNYIQLDEIAAISRFRSAVGHDYSDDFETCRSMKHYFLPNEVDPEGQQEHWGDIEIFSPIEGEIISIQEEWAGTQIQIRSVEHPEYHFILFHLDSNISLNIGLLLEEGELLGTHIGSQTMSDIAVGVEVEEGWQLLSYFDVMTNQLFEEFQSNGILERNEVIISKAERDEHLLLCNENEFDDSSELADWVELN
jgi:hypothetical protein